MMLVNGEVGDVIAATDRGLAYGDGLFETLRAQQGGLPLLEYHLDRLFQGFAALRFPNIARALLTEELERAAAAQRDGVVKLIVTRGSGARGYRPPQDCVPNRIVLTSPLSPDIPAWRNDGIVLRYCDTLLEGPSALAGLKHLNRLPQVLARMEWTDPGIHEGLMRDAAGNVLAGTMSNLFMVKQHRLYTPPVDAGVRGVMRRLVLELARDAGLEYAESPLAPHDLREADEVFVTNAVIGVCPVRAIGVDRQGIGTITRQLQAAVENRYGREK